ncbi:MAG: hypothetical protein KatS3mg114_0389 [Planctomycetaceae bacterium]|nr:MAG: hypothetical protein KatS3mg114_0389 [Planctomycetaceae bacterium]
MASVNPTSNSSSISGNVPTISADKVGFAGLTSETFLKLLITQLQNQDPLDPMDNDQLLRQISEMRNLQANLELQSTLKNLSLSQQLNGAASFLGRRITAVKTDSQEEIQGVVEEVIMRESKAYLRVGENEVELSEVRRLMT